VYSDTTVWSAIIPPATRQLAAHGSLGERAYRFDISAARTPLTKLGDTRHVITLQRLAGGDYQWTTGVDFAMGSMTAADVANLLTALLTAVDARDASTTRAAARGAFPRSSIILGRLFAIDSLVLRPGPQATTTISLNLAVHTDTLAKTAPHFADYVRKYVEKSRFRFSLVDKSGAMFFEATGGAGTIAVRYRVRGGEIVSYVGPPRTMPDSLRLVSDLSMRVKLFDVGWKNLVTDFTFGRSDRSRSWLIVARQEPDWQLPLITARLIRAPLRRPFEGNGSSFEVAVIDSNGGQSILARRARFEVKESGIMRFLSGLVSRVFDDLDVEVEREEAAYVRELMAAFQFDARRLLSKAP
jgi:hypothetical protein